MVIDAVAPQSDTPVFPQDYALDDKLQYLEASQVHLGLVGDAMFYRGLGSLKQWLRYRHESLDICSPEQIDIAAIATQKHRIAARNIWGNALGAKGVFLYICTRQTTCYWLLQPDETGQLHRTTERPIALQANTVLLNYGGVETLVPAPKSTRHSAAATLQKLLEETHQHHKQEGHRLPYDFYGRFSSVTIPQCSTQQIQYTSPFENFSEAIAGPYGGAANWNLLQDPSYIWDV